MAGGRLVIPPCRGVGRCRSGGPTFRNYEGVRREHLARGADRVAVLGTGEQVGKQNGVIRSHRPVHSLVPLLARQTELNPSTRRHIRSPSNLDSGIGTDVRTGTVQQGRGIEQPGPQAEPDEPEQKSDGHHISRRQTLIQ